MKTATAVIRFKITNLQAVERVLKRIEDSLVGPAFEAGVRATLESKANIRRLTRVAQEKIQELIYDVHEDPGDRTYAALHSFKAVAASEFGSTVRPGLAVYSEINEESANTANPEGKFSYVAFFERPVEWSSFIAESGDPYRPFFEVLTNEVKNEIDAMTLDSMMRYLRLKLPNTA